MTANNHADDRERDERHPDPHRVPAPSNRPAGAARQSAPHEWAVA